MTPITRRSLPVGFSGPITVITGPRLLAGVNDPPGYLAHRHRWPRPHDQNLDTLIHITEQCAIYGRGGAGFPFSRKLSTAAQSGKRREVIINASEGEPGSAKDSSLLATVPHLVFDGAVTTAHALGTKEIHLVMPSERPAVRAAVEHALEERGDDGVIFILSDTDGGFVGGQAKAVTELLSNRPNLPVTSWQPEAVKGFKGRPTVLSNAETFAQVAVASVLGPRGYAGLGTPEEPGTTLLTVAGDGPNGVVIEVPFGASFPDILRFCGYEPHSSVLLGGYHGSWIPAAQVQQLTLTRAAIKTAGSSIGAGVILPVAANACPVVLTARVVTYLAAESAGRCGPCRNGLPALAEACNLLAAGRAGPAALDRIEHLTGVLPGRGACAHPDGTVRSVQSMMRVFAREVANHVSGPCRATEGRW